MKGRLSRVGHPRGKEGGSFCGPSPDPSLEIKKKGGEAPDIDGLGLGK